MLYYRWYHSTNLKMFQFEGKALDMQWFAVREQMETHWKFRAPMGEKQKKKRAPSGLLAFRFPNFAPTQQTLELALEKKYPLTETFRDNKDLIPIHPKETLIPNQIVVLKRFPLWLWIEAMEEFPEQPSQYLYPSTASEEDKMYINMRMSAWTRPTIFKPYCFICGDPNHLQTECPQRRICGQPKNM